jgi:tetratricopeptide (TPR) repeat protein
MAFCPIPPQDSSIIPILFEIKIDHNQKSTACASLNNVSYYSDSEEEILFSMHAVFRIDEVNPSDDQYWIVKLTLTNDKDQDLKILTERLREETLGTTGWDQLGKLLIHMNQILIEKISKDNDIGLANRYHQLGIVTNGKGDYNNAFLFYQKAFQIYEKSLSLNDLALATPYSSIGTVFFKIGDYAKAMEFYQKSLKIYEDLLPNDSVLATVYNNIGQVYETTGEYLEALKFLSEITWNQITVFAFKSFKLGNSLQKYCCCVH